jgi:uncharacterized protein DUF3500
VFGDPGGEGAWGWRFGGHHVSLNNLVVAGELVSTTPCFLGVNPASSPLLGGAVQRPLARVEDLARELVVSLPPELAARATLPGRVPDDILTGNRPQVGEAIRPLGVAARDLEPAQRGLLEALLGTYVERVPPGVAPAYDVTALSFAWSGPVGPGLPHYYRIQGPDLLIEWDNTQDAANHAHAVWREPASDFGLDVLASHRATHHR